MCVSLCHYHSAQSEKVLAFNRKMANFHNTKPDAGNSH